MKGCECERSLSADLKISLRFHSTVSLPPFCQRQNLFFSLHTFGFCCLTYHVSSDISITHPQCLPRFSWRASEAGETNLCLLVSNITSSLFTSEFGFYETHSPVMFWVCRQPGRSSWALLAPRLTAMSCQGTTWRQSAHEANAHSCRNGILMNPTSLAIEDITRLLLCLQLRFLSRVLEQNAVCQPWLTALSWENKQRPKMFRRWVRSAPSGRKRLNLVSFLILR